MPKGVEHAADLHIHVFDGITDDDLAAFFANQLGSKWCDEAALFGPNRVAAGDRWGEAYERVAATPHIWIGRASWLQAGLTGDSARYVPSTVMRVFLRIGEDLPSIDDGLIADVLAALRQANMSDPLYTVNTDLRAVWSFLDAHRGKPVFTVSW